MLPLLPTTSKQSTGNVPRVTPIDRTDVIRVRRRAGGCRRVRERLRKRKRGLLLLLQMMELLVVVVVVTVASVVVELHADVVVEKTETVCLSFFGGALSMSVGFFCLCDTV